MFCDGQHLTLKPYYHCLPDSEGRRLPHNFTSSLHILQRSSILFYAISTSFSISKLPTLNREQATLFSRETGDKWRCYPERARNTPLTSSRSHASHSRKEQDHLRQKASKYSPTSKDTVTARKSQGGRLCRGRKSEKGEIEERKDLVGHHHPSWSLRLGRVRGMEKEMEMARQ